jgi:hypothetical protein
VIVVHSRKRLSRHPQALSGGRRSFPDTGNSVEVDDRQLRDSLADTEGLLTWSMAGALGLTRSAVRWALRTQWRFVLPGVMATTREELVRRQELVAALLMAGPGSMIASLTAAEWHGVTAAAEPGVRVLVPAARHPASHGFVVVRRTRRPDPTPWYRGVLTIVSRPRAVVDAARDCGSADRARALVSEAVQRRLVTPESLRHELEAGARAGSRIVRVAVDEVEAGSWSIAESDLYRLVTACRRLPPMWLNPILTGPDGMRLPTPDGWFDSVGLAVQVHSWRWHASPADWNATVMRDGVFAEYGIPVVGVTPNALRHSPDDVLRRIERALGQLAGRPRPDVIAVSRTGQGVA